MLEPRPHLAARIDNAPRTALTALSLTEVAEATAGFVRRQLPIFLIINLCALVLGLFYLFAAPSKYTAKAMLLIDSSKVRMLQQQQATLGEVPMDTAQVETQVEVLKSEGIGLSVIRDMQLTSDPEFVGSQSVFDLLGNILPFSSSGEKSEHEKTRRALRQFMDRRTVGRVGRTYVLEISFTSLDRNKAAAIANGIADSYIVDQLEAKYQATRRASQWLQERIRELRQQASAADRAVLEFKENNNIVDANTPNSGGRILLTEQQISELNTQLSQARAAKAEAQARLDRITQMREQDIPDAAVVDALRSEVITKLRNQYLEIAAKERIWAKRYGENHLAAVNLRSQMTEIKTSIADELNRIAESYKSDVEIAATRETNIEKALSGLVLEARGTNRDKLGLRDLESQAQVYHTIYDNFLQRYMEAIQQQSFPITEARVISLAAAPTSRSTPQAPIVIGISLILGMMASTAVSVLREAIDRAFRTTRQVEEALGVPCLAVLPALSAEGATVPTSAGKSASSSTRREFLRHVVDDPLSSFAEAMRSVKVALDIDSDAEGCKVLGVTSTLPKEGKSTVSSNFAHFLAHAGKRVVLIEADLRNPALTRELAASAKAGMLEVLAGKSALNQALLSDARTGLRFLPAIVESRLFHTNEVLTSNAFRSLIAELRSSYDYIILDLPPIAPVVDARATVGIVDKVLFVVEWGRTNQNLVQHQLQAAPEIQEKLLGVVLNKANVKVLERYEHYYGGDYTRRYYSKYSYGT